jgi:hypothetical protein
LAPSHANINFSLKISHAHIYTSAKAHLSLYFFFFTLSARFLWVLTSRRRGVFMRVPSGRLGFPFYIFLRNKRGAGLISPANLGFLWDPDRLCLGCLVRGLRLHHGKSWRSLVVSGDRGIWKSELLLWFDKSFPGC